MSDTLHAAITAELGRHPRWIESGRGRIKCQHPLWTDTPCTWSADFPPARPSALFEAHQADRIMAVLADRLPHTPPDQLADLIGGQAESAAGWSRVEGPWVADSPPAAPEPRQDT